MPSPRKRGGGAAGGSKWQMRVVKAKSPTKTSWLIHLRLRWLLPVVLSTTAGAVDVIGFLALDGLFTAHITGNLVILAAHYVTGGFCQVGPLLSVPVFIAVLGVVTLASGAVARAGSSPLRRGSSCKRPSWPGFWGSGSGSAPSPMPTARWRCSWACSGSRRWPPRTRR